MNVILLGKPKKTYSTEVEKTIECNEAHKCFRNKNLMANISRKMLIMHFSEYFIEKSDDNQSRNIMDYL